jgi:hypothetical protein
VLRVEVAVPFLLLILCVSFAILTPAGNAAPMEQGISSAISSDSVSVSVNFQIFQNLTQLDTVFALPQFNGVLNGANSTDMASAVQQAIDSKSSQAKVSSLSLRLSTTSWNANSNIQWFNTSLQFQVRGAQTLQNGVGKIDMSWKSFSVLQNVTIGGVEVNNIGSKYLSAAAGRIAQGESTTGTFITYTNTVNSFRTRAANMATIAQEISLLDFSRIQPTIDAWHEKYDFSSGTVTWTFKPSVVLGIIVTESVAEQQPPTKVNYVLSYGLQASLSAPMRSYAQGNTITVTFGDNNETLMGTIIVSIAALGIVTFVYEARFVNRGIKRKSKR